jgi:hypothetical protein
MLTVGSMSAAFDEAISEICTGGTELSQCLPDKFCPLHHQFLASQKRLQDLSNFVLLVSARYNEIRDPIVRTYG